jgi:hypothetical protein
VNDWELLDREKDPLETRNYYNDPAYAQTVKELHADIERLRKELKDTGDSPRAAYGNRPFEGEPQPPAAPAKKAKKKS